MLESLVDASPEEAEGLYTLYEDYRGDLKLELACLALSEAIHTQVDEQKRTYWEEEFDTLGCQSRVRDEQL